MAESRRLASSRTVGKPALIVIISLVSTLIAWPLSRSGIGNALNDALYDYAYRLWPVSTDRNSPVVIVNADEASLNAMASGANHWAWPWPRQFWGFALEYVQKCGAKAAAVDVLFQEPSQYNGELGDDAVFAGTLDGLKIPVVQAIQVTPDGSPGRFAPPVKRPPILAAVTLPDGASIRNYSPQISGVPSLALQTIRAAGYPQPEWADRPFRICYYGPHLAPDGRSTFTYVPANNVFEAMRDPAHPQSHGIDPSVFKNKIVLFGTTAQGTFDLKAVPVDARFPGVEIHATAIENLLNNQHVRVAPPGIILGTTVVTAFLATLCAVLPRRTSLKLLLSLLAAGGLAGVVVTLFRVPNAFWLAPLGPMAALAAAVVLALSWSYFAEDRQARFFLRALGQYVSPEVAADLKANPKKLSLSAERGELTILFSDIVGFTDLSERLAERVGPLLNYYLDEMSQPVLAEDGTVDKYIGDAIMSFWNAPVPQPDHAARACRAALAMQRRLDEIQPQLADLGAPGLAARIGINTGACTFGNMGSRAKFNYSVIGDACNFASRLEGANKIYGTRILIGETTARLVRAQFCLRKVDVLRVKGKLKPQAVFELLGEGPPDPRTAEHAARYEAALSHYCAGEWEAAEQCLLELLAAAPEDGPARELMSRVAAFRREPPAAPWDGVFVAKQK